MSRTRAVLTAAVLLSALALGGCTDDDPEPKFGPTESTSPASPTSPSTSSAAGTVAPTLPSAAQGSTAASAEAFVKFYWEAVNYAQSSGDLRLLRGLGSPSCTACNAGVSYLEQVFDAGGHVVGGVGSLSVQKSSLVEGDGQLSGVVKFVLTTTPQRVDFEGTSKDESYPGGTKTVNALVEPAGGSWIMTSWGIQQ
ncbi:DUF6318 family protein [Nocardioides hankookensis]|uniref:DUF6318 family protein n=1 Tax=Nocardioides hankookensis TaxID=443157 RepID=A0ABW1LSJ6_9ACTN